MFLNKRSKIRVSKSYLSYFVLRASGLTGWLFYRNVQMHGFRLFALNEEMFDGQLYHIYCTFG
jgi:hypothetical protein